MQEAVCTHSINETIENDRLLIFKSVAMLVFELLDLHPFSDGNGRCVGYYLVMFSRRAHLAFPSPIYNSDKYMHALIAARKFVYPMARNVRHEKLRKREQRTNMAPTNNSIL